MALTESFKNVMWWFKNRTLEKLQIIDGKINDCLKEIETIKRRQWNVVEPDFNYNLTKEERIEMTDTLIYELVLNPVSEDVEKQELEVTIDGAAETKVLAKGEDTTEVRAPQGSSVVLRLRYLDDANNASEWVVKRFTAVDTLAPNAPIGIGQLTLVAEEEGEEVVEEEQVDEVVDEVEETTDEVVEEAVEEVVEDVVEDVVVENDTVVEEVAEDAVEDDTDAEDED